MNKPKRIQAGIVAFMKFACIQITIAVTLSAVAYSHESRGQQVLDERVSLHVRNETIKSVLKTIEDQLSITFTYNAELLANRDKVTLSLKRTRLADVIDAIFDHSVEYEALEDQVILRPRKRSFFRNATWFGQNAVQVSGTVSDENGLPLPGVNVIEKGTTKGTSTDADGKYSIAVNEGAHLVFSFIGYQTQEFRVDNQTEINVTMIEEMTSLDEVVVVGYGTVKKSDLTGAVANVGEREIKATPIVDLGRALQGRAAGVLVTQNSASPGAPATIRIRGTGSVNAGNDPLYVIDGFPTDNINSINPSDIASIEILKDASSTAIYGSRGSNGVVLVTTKRGKSGRSTIDFESYYGVQSVRRKIPLLNAQQYAEFINEARINGGAEAYFDGSSDERPLPSQLGKGTDWQDEVFRTAPIQNYQLTLSGGENKTRYALSGNYYDQDGIILNSDFKRSTLRANLDHDISSRVSVGLSMQGAFTLSNAARTETDGGASSGVTNAAINYAPTFPVYNSDGTYYRNQGTLNGNLVDNPVGLANEITNEYLTNRVLANVFLDIEILKGLKFRTSWGADLNNWKSNFYATRQIGLGLGTNGTAAVSAGMMRNGLNENTLTYHKTFQEKHDVTALIGYTTQAYHTESVQANAINFNDDFARFNNLAAGATLQSPGSSASDWALTSYLARINYSFADRFLATFTARRDGSSRFGSRKKYGFFPSGALAWKVINESFMKDQNVFSDLKLRVSYGLTGNQEIGDYSYLSFISNVRYPFGGANPVLQVGGVPAGISNLALGWEKNEQLDAGIDFAFFSHRLNLTADYYIKTTSDLLFSVNVPQTTGYSSSLRNIGQVENRGLEIAISSENIAGSAFQWSTDFNIAFNRNKVLALDGRPEFTDGAGSGHLVVFNTVLMKVGEPLGNFYGRQVAGIFQSEEEVAASPQAATAKPGDLRYADLNNDGAINDLDRTVIGNGNPDFFGGLNNTFTYKGIELNIFFQGSFGNEILNFGRFDLYNLNGNNNQSADVLQRWTPEHPSNTIPRANIFGGNRILSSFHIEDASYVRLKNISLGYQLPEHIFGPLPIQSVKVYVAAQNWLTFTKYKGYDPEVSRFGSSSINQGMDYGGYPASKTLLVGLNIKL
ncbi:MAG TPA: TonB-dependent receptor [Chryseosolibacter sp.]|nr:TonB-dependent receptor [Chryseosolibacter sp.]